MTLVRRNSSAAILASLRGYEASRTDDHQWDGRPCCNERGDDLLLLALYREHPERIPSFNLYS